MNNIGNIYYEKNDNDKALDHYTRSLEVRKELGDKQGIGNSLYNIGNIYDEKNDIDLALNYYIRSLEIRRELDDKEGVGFTLGQMGQSYYKKGDYDKALDHYTNSLEIREELSDKRGIGYLLNCIGIYYLEKGDPETSVEYLEKSLAIQEEIGMKVVDLRLEVISYLNLSFKQLGKEFDRQKIYALIKEVEKIEYDINFCLFKLFDDKSYLDIAYEQVKEKADALEDSEKFLNYPIPKAIVEAWESIK